MGHHQYRQSRRHLPAVLAALISLTALSGCVSVDSGPQLPSARPSLAPAAARTPTALPTVPAEPSARTAIFRTGEKPRSSAKPEKPKRPAAPPPEQPREHERQAADDPPAQRRRPPAAAAPSKAPQKPAERRRTRTTVQRPPTKAAPRPRQQPQRPAATYDMRAVCGTAADHQLNPSIVALCRGNFGG
ncbi:hypothetical protein [Streptomyces sp. NPDC002324]